MSTQTSEMIAAALQMNDPTARKEAQRVFIETRMATSKLFDKYGLTHSESNQVIVKSLMGEMRNLVQQFFKGSGSGFSVKRCDACGTTDPAMQYDRAHDKGSSRGGVALNALQRVRSDETVPISQKDVMKAFVKEHAEFPLWYLCKTCHRAYDH